MIVRQNQFINHARSIQGLPIYTLDGGDYGYEPGEYAWHTGDFWLMIRRLSTIEFIEFFGDLIVAEVFTTDEINELLEEENASFRFYKSRGIVTVEILELTEIESLMEKLDSDAESIHTNIRVLLARAEQGIVANDFPATIHDCASVFESLAKDIISDTAIDDKPLGGFFLKYKKNSNLPEPILDFMINQYNLRNTTPLAGHGSRLAPPIISKEEATLLVELTKAFVKTEYKLLSKGVVTIPLAPTRG